MSNSEPLVTVFIPSYNHAQYVLTAVQSVLSQSYPNLELIIIDDGSSDNSHDVLHRNFSTDNRVTLILNPKNKGQSAVFNQAIDLARGEYISYLPSDDWYLSNKLQLQVDRFRDLPDKVGVVYGRGARYYEDTGVTLTVDRPLFRGDVLRKFAEFGQFVYPATPMFRRACFDKVRPDNSYRAEGEAIYLKLALYFEFDYIDEILAVMRDHSYNTGKDVRMMYEDNLRYSKELSEHPDMPDDVRKTARAAINALHRCKGLEFITRTGDMRDGRKALSRLVASQPSALLDYRVSAGLTLTLLPNAISSWLLRMNGHTQSRDTIDTPAHIDSSEDATQKKCD